MLLEKGVIIWWAACWLAGCRFVQCNNKCECSSEFSYEWNSFWMHYTESELTSPSPPTQPPPPTFNAGITVLSSRYLGTIGTPLNDGTGRGVIAHLDRTVFFYGCTQHVDEDNKIRETFLLILVVGWLVGLNRSGSQEERRLMGWANKSDSCCCIIILSNLLAQRLYSFCPVLVRSCNPFL